MSAFQISDIDEVIHGRMRLGIMAYLSSVHEADFNDLKARLQASDGNLSIHLRKLEEAGYIALDKSFRERKPLTRARMTEQGRDAYIAYLDTLRAVIGEGSV